MTGKVTQADAAKLLLLAEGVGLTTPRSDSDGGLSDDELTRLWAAALRHITMRDAVQALEDIARDGIPDYVLKPSHIMARARKVRDRRLSRVLPPPNADPDDEAAYRAEMLALRDWVADGGRPDVPLNASLEYYATHPTTFSLTGSHTALAALEAGSADEIAAAKDAFAWLPRAIGSGDAA